MAGWLRYWMHRVCFESVGGRKETKKNTAPKRRRLTKKRKTKTRQEPIITWSFIIGGIGESGSVAKQEGRGEKRGWRARRPFVFLRSTARRVDRALNHPLPSLPLSIPSVPGLGLPLVVPPIREAVAKPTARHVPPPVSDLIAKASASN